MTEIGFNGQVAVVTGAGNGLGRAYALALAARGASVVVNDLGSNIDGSGSSQHVADAVVDEIRRAGAEAVASYDNVATPEGGSALIERAASAFGRLDIVINNAGILRHRPFLQQTLEDWDLTLATHLSGAFYVSQPAFRTMAEAGYGRILFTSSLVGLFGESATSAYAAAKAGVIGLMHALASEGEQHGIRCNTLLPSAQTRMGGGDDEHNLDEHNDLRRVREALAVGFAPEFVVPLALFLVSDRCRVTDSIYSAASGRYARAFVGLGRGWHGPTDLPASPEEVESHFDTICDEADYIIPSSTADVFAAIAEARATRR